RFPDTLQPLLWKGRTNGLREVEIVARVFQRRGSAGQSARGGVERWHQSSLFPGKSKRNAARQEKPDFVVRLWRLRNTHAAGLQRGGGICVAGAGWSLRARQHPRGRRIRAQVARSGSQSESPACVRRLYSGGGGPHPE